MVALLIDSYRLFATLKDRGFSDDQAKGIAEAIQQIDLSALATRADLKTELADFLGVHLLLTNPI